MPSYTFKCKKCNNVFDVIKSMNDNSDVLCPSCGSVSERSFSSSSLLIKGNGFYQNIVMRK